MSKLEQLNAFIEVIGARSFTGAARKLEISKAAVSKKIHLLETELGIQLIQRTTRKLELTESGQIYFDHCLQLMESLKEADRLVAHLKAEPFGVLRVTSSHYFADQYILPQLKTFLEMHPKVRLELELAERIPDLFREEIDILFGYSMRGPSESVQKKFSTTRYVFCASPAYLKKWGTPREPKDLSDHRYINHAMRRPVNRVDFDSKTQVTVTPYLVLNDSRAMLQSALNHIGIVRLHRYGVEDYLRRGALVEVFSDWSREEVPIYLYYQPGKYLQPKVRRFVDFFSN